MPCTVPAPWPSCGLSLVEDKGAQGGIPCAHGLRATSGAAFIIPLLGHWKQQVLDVATDIA